MKRQQQGVMLLEAMIAVILLGMGLIGAVLIQARSIGALSDSTMRAEATMASESLVGLITNDLPNADQYALVANATPSARLAPWVTETRRVIPAATVAVTVSPAVANSTYRQVGITISWVRKQGDTPSLHVLTAHLAGSQ